MEAPAKIGAEFDSTGLDQDELHAERRWREDVRLRALARRAPEPFRVPTSGWIGCIALLLALVLLRNALLPHRVMPHDTTSVQIVLLDAPAQEPALPEPAPLPIHPATRTLRPAPRIALPVPSAAPSPLAVDSTPAPLNLFNADGSLALPREHAQRADTTAATFSAPLLPESIGIMRHQRPLKVRPNHFAANFRHASGSALTDFVEDHLTARKEFTLPWGTHVECVGVSLFVAFVGGCGWYTPYRYYIPTERWKPSTELDEQ